MGNNSSQREEAECMGYRVLGVQPCSPAAQGGLVSFFDFIVEANGIPFKSLDGTFVELIQSSEDKPLPLTVYNWKSRTIREVVLVPSRKWPGEGMLGVTIRFDTYHNAEENICHVLEVEANSPAELSGLQAGSDYLLGTAEAVFKDTDALGDCLAANINRPVEFYVYNSETDVVRIVLLMPSPDWAGEGTNCGLLGASVAHGLLHVLPGKCCLTIGISHEGSSKSVLNSPFGLNTINDSPSHQQQQTSTGTVTSSSPIAQIHANNFTAEQQQQHMSDSNDHAVLTPPPPPVPLAVN